MPETPNPVQIVKDVLRNIPTGNETVFDLAKEIGSDGTPKQVITVIQRKVNPEPPAAPVKAESPRRGHQFFEAAGFVAYLDRYGGENTIVLANPVDRTVTAVLDEKAEKGFERIALAPPLHPTFEPWYAMFGERIPLGQFAEFIIANRSTVTAPAPKALSMLFRQVTVAEGTTMQRGTGANSINGVVVVRTIKGNKDEQPMDLPDQVIITCPLLACSLDNRSLEVDLTVGMADGKVYVLPTCAESEVQLAEEFDALVKALKFKAPGVVVGSGKIQHNDWAYLAIR